MPVVVLKEEQKENVGETVLQWQHTTANCDFRTAYWMRPFVDTALVVKQNVLNYAGIDQSIFMALSVQCIYLISIWGQGHHSDNPLCWSLGYGDRVSRVLCKPNHKTAFGNAVLSKLSTTDWPEFYKLTVTRRHNSLKYTYRIPYTSQW